MRFLAAVLLLVPAFAFGQSVDMPQSVLAKRGRSVQVEITYDGDDLKWTTPAELDVFREWSEDPKTVSLRVLIPPETPDGSYPISAVTAKLVGDKAKLSKFESCLIVVGGGPVPPPRPEPPIPPKPEPPPNPPNAGPRQLLIFRESAQDTPLQSLMFNGLQAGVQSIYLKGKGHGCFVLQADDKGPDGNPPAIVEQWKPHFDGMAFPVLIITDKASGKILHKTTLEPKASADDVLNILKQFGG